jgi:hypothetical protein
VLACRQDARVYEQVVLYACDGKDAAVAQKYFPNLPPQLRPALEQRCKQQGITLHP